MNLSWIMRSSYWLAWLLAALSVIYRGLEYLRSPITSLPVTSRGVFFASAFLFLACIATFAYVQVTHSVQEKGKSAAA